jgi:hypothetical protein
MAFAVVAIPISVEEIDDGERSIQLFLYVFPLISPSRFKPHDPVPQKQRHHRLVQVTTRVAIPITIQ